MTPAELVKQLSQLGIDRSERTLTDWRQKRLLPPLRRMGLGCGSGTTQGWTQPVVEHAIAVHHLMTDHRHADAVRLRLWLSGYSIDARSAQEAWVRCLEGELGSMRRAASRSKNSYFGVGKSLWGELSRDRNDLPSPRRVIIESISGQEGEPGSAEHAYRQRVARAVADWFGWHDTETGRNPVTYRQAIGEFVGTTIEWCYDDSERDDEAYRNRIAEALTSLNESQYEHVVPADDLYGFVEAFWRRVDYATIFRPGSAIGFVRSLSECELNSTRRSLAEIREIIEHVLKLLDSSIERTSCIRKQLDVMDGLGPLLALSMLSLKRKLPNWPLVESISTLHAFSMSVKSEDLLNKNNKLLSQRAQLEWQTAKQILAQLWSPIQEATQEKQP